MTGFLVMLLVTSILTNVYLGFVKKNKPEAQLSVAPAPTVKVIEPPKPKVSKHHKLVETFSNMKIDQYNTGNYIKYLGWHYHCTCGTIAPATDNDRADDYGIEAGSEAGAVKAWHNHMVMHIELVDAGEDALAEIQEEFDRFKKECYCHDIA